MQNGTDSDTKTAFVPSAARKLPLDPQGLRNGVENADGSVTFTGRSRQDRRNFWVKFHRLGFIYKNIG
jgi:hypothetical protein